MTNDKSRQLPAGGSCIKPTDLQEVYHTWPPSQRLMYH